MKDIHCFIKRKDALSQIRRMTAAGYFFHTKGIVKKSHLQKLIAKFADRYGIDQSKDQRYRNKKKQIANSHCVLFFPENNEENIYFWLLATEGKGLVFDLEDMLDARNKKERLTTHDGDYYLVKTPRKDSQPRWTWRLTQEHFESLKERIKRAIRNKNDFQLQQLHHNIVRIAGFSESRKQGFTLLRYMRNEWHRSRKKSEDYPFEGAYIGYIGRFKKAEKVVLS